MFMKSCIATLSILLYSTAAMAGNNGLLGALIGAGVGAGVGHSVDRTGGSGKGALIGAIGGYVIGNQIDKQKQAPTPPPANTQAATPPATQQHSASLSSSDCNRAKQYLQQATDTRDNADKVYFLEKATKLCPRNAQAHNDLGVAYYTRNERYDRDRARTEFREALNIDPNYDVARNNLNSL